MNKQWNEADRQAFADRNILKAQRIADKRKKQTNQRVMIVETEFDPEFLKDKES